MAEVDHGGVQRLRRWFGEPIGGDRRHAGCDRRQIGFYAGEQGVAAPAVADRDVVVDAAQPGAVAGGGAG
ncbi:hypothetical protein Ae331Ps2_6342c [Pseudonocardia sp. Ae331_Ps2]|nr:hypothetical protein Ae331Ps2_6342c [Pseudonocardia sp. Ae331_Ps2]